VSEEEQAPTEGKRVQFTERGKEIGETSWPPVLRKRLIARVEALPIPTIRRANLHQLLDAVRDAKVLVGDEMSPRQETEVRFALRPGRAPDRDSRLRPPRPRRHKQPTRPERLLIFLPSFSEGENLEGRRSPADDLTEENRLRREEAVTRTRRQRLLRKDGGCAWRKPVRTICSTKERSRR